MTTTSVNLYAAYPSPSATNLLDALDRLPPARKPKSLRQREQAPSASWFSEGWEGAGFSPFAVIVELAALTVFVVAALFTA